MIAAAVTVIVIAVLFYAALALGWWLLLTADKEGMEPHDELAAMNHEDGGAGPIP